jgi:RNA polymerase sigma-70 factor, ECF subfamily
MESEADRIAAARAAWPDLTVPDDVFLNYLAERADHGVTGVGSVADLYLACACVRQDANALAAFENRCIAGLVEALVRQDLPRDIVEDAVQNVRQKLLCAPPGAPSKIADYRGAGGLAGWVKVIAVREALQILRKQRPSAADDRLTEMPIDASNPELEHFRRVYAEEFREALLVALDGLTRRERNVLRYQYVYRMTIDQIGAVYHVHRVTASRWEVKARTTLLTKTRRRLMQRLDVSAEELESIMRIIQSQLDVSLLRHLGEDETSRGSG